MSLTLMAFPYCLSGCRKGRKEGSWVKTTRLETLARTRGQETTYLSEYSQRNCHEGISEDVEALSPARRDCVKKQSLFLRHMAAEIKCSEVYPSRKVLFTHFPGWSSLS